MLILIHPQQQQNKQKTFLELPELLIFLLHVMVSRPLAIICLRPFSSCHRQMLTIAAISVACSSLRSALPWSLVSTEIVVTEVADDPFEVDSTVLFFAEQYITHTLSFNCLASFRDLFSF